MPTAQPFRLARIRRNRAGGTGRLTPPARRSARAAVRWFVGWAAVFVVVGNALIDGYRPEAVDREYAARLAILRARQAEHPDRPLLLVTGSSRVVLGFAPERLPPMADAAGRAVLPVNVAHFGGGPVLTRMLSGRLVRDGVRPRWVVVELMPAFFPRENARLLTSLASAADIADTARYHPAGELPWEFVRHRTAGLPAFAHRAVRPAADGRFGPLGGLLELRAEASADERRREAAVQAGHFARLLTDWRPAAGADRAVRDTVALWRSHAAEVRLLMCPEGAEHRKLYGPGGADRVARYANELAADLGVPLTDARGWLPDADLSDGHHPLRRGAEAVTDRLGRDVLGPWVAGR